MGNKPEGCVIHRKDHGGAYCKANCVWMNRLEHLRLHGAERKGRPRAKRIAA
jgi:hypothetical protein